MRELQNSRERLSREKR